MKAALQEADEAEAEGGGSESPRMKDAKGRDILSPEEKARKDERTRKLSAEARQSYVLQQPFSHSSIEISCSRETRADARGESGT